MVWDLGFLIKISLVILLFVVVLGGGSCARQTSSEAASGAKKSQAEFLTGENSENPQLAAAQELIRREPNVAEGYVKLSAAYIRLARETGDFSLNRKAEAAAEYALQIEPQNLSALKLKNALHLTFHRFAEAREMALNLQKQNPRDAFFYGVLTDANVELGNYEEAVENAQKMVDLKPNLESYARVSYLRSLHGDTDGAIEAMRMAANIADPSNPETKAWCLARLGDEYFRLGKFAEAEREYDHALQTFPDYYLAVAGKGRARAAENDLETAVNLLTSANNRVPNVENIIFLGDVLSRLNRSDEARKQYDLAQFIEEKFGNIDRRRLALLWADKDERLDEALAIARREREQRQDIYTADILAWCLYKNGDAAAAKKAIDEALRLKTKDARIFYHAGMIYQKNGDLKNGRKFLQEAIKLNPAFDLIEIEKAKAAAQYKSGAN
jgi:tetratricopeptide (TPR) repeat protein